MRRGVPSHIGFQHIPAPDHITTQMIERALRFGDRL